MEPPTTVYLRRQGRAFGPFTLEQLRELAAAGAIGADAEAAVEPEDRWLRLDALPLGAQVFAQNGCQKAAFARTETNAGPPINLADIIAAAQPRGNVAAKATPPKAVSAEHDVHSLLELNRRIDVKHGLFAIAPVAARKSKRWRDYWILLLGVGALILIVLVAETFLAVSIQTMAAGMPDQFWPVLRAVLFQSPIMAWGLAMFAFYATALTWLLFGLMDDY